MGEFVVQTSGIGHDDAWGWACPYCRGRNSLMASTCEHCGAQLRDPDEDDLFTTVAADNAEVVPPEQPFSRDNMWTTDAAEPGDDAAVDAGPVDDGDLWDPAADDPVAGFRPAFSAEPAQRPDDVVDEPYHVDDGRPHGGRSPGLFSSSGAAPVPDDLSGGLGRSPFAAPAGPPPTAPAPSAAPGPAPAGDHGPFTAPTAPAPEWSHQAPRAEPYPDPRYEPPPAAPHTPPHAAAAPSPASASRPVPDPHGLSAAVARLRPEDQEAAAVPISVVGALLQADEVVLAAVTGQMLGHPAVVVLTTRRVLVVNGRRWQPIVDVFDVGPDLVVRGRHDRDVAALSFADASRLSTVDAITEVSLAVELAERIRGVGP